MSRIKKEQCEEDLRRICRERRTPLTEQRKAVLRTVLDMGCHPTAEEVCRRLASCSAGVSRATVYRTLESLSRLGTVLKLDLGGNAIRYDGRTEMHHHLVCTLCNQVIDVTDPELDSIKLPDMTSLGFIVKDFRVQISGICRCCLRN